MDYRSIDIETNVTDDPRDRRMTVLSYYESKTGANGLLQGEAALEYFVDTLELVIDQNLILVNHNIPFDMFVLVFNELPEAITLAFEAYDTGRILDTMVNEKIIDIRGAEYDKDKHRKVVRRGKSVETCGYGLGDLCKFHFGLEIEGKETTRKGYGPLRNIPLEEWDDEFIDYALADTPAAGELWESQSEFFIPHFESESRAAWAFELINNHGIRVDPEAIQNLEEEIVEEIQKYEEILLNADFLKKKKVSTADVEPDKEKRDQAKQELLEAVQRALGSPKVKTSIHWLEEALDWAVGDDYDTIKKWVKVGRDSGRIEKVVDTAFDFNPPLTEKDKKPKTDADTLVEAAALAKCKCGAVEKDGVCKASCPAVVRHISAWTSANKILSTYIRALKKADDENIIRPNFNSIVGTYRTSCQRPNLQNLPKKSGVRECYIPRDGHYFIATDYTTLELRTLAQVTLRIVGWSKLAEALNKGLDPHLDLAAEILKISYEKALALYKSEDVNINHYRNLAKIANFGYPGGLQPKAFVLYAFGYGVIISEQEAEDLFNSWLTKWPEMQIFFDETKSLCDSYQGGFPKIPGLDVIRGGVKFTEACNFYFQGFAAIGAKAALYKILKECYADEESPLYKCRVVAFIHDEILLEAPIARAAQAAARQEEIMREQMAEIVPDVPILVDSAMMKRWSKKAKNRRNERGELELWVP